MSKKQGGLSAQNQSNQKAAAKPQQSFSDPVPWTPNVQSKRDRESETNPEDDPGMQVVHSNQQAATGSREFDMNKPEEWEPIIRPVLEDVENLRDLQAIYSLNDHVEGFRLRLAKVSWVLEEAIPSRPGSYKAKTYAATAIKCDQGPPSLIASWFPAGSGEKKGK